jgi:hypothetical protein
MATTPMISPKQRRALESLADAFLPDELRPKRRARQANLRRVGGIALLVLVAVGVYAAFRRAGE